LRLRVLFSLTFLLFLLSHSSHAQSPTGTISGIVTDPTGAPIVGAEILVVNDLTRVQYPGKTNNEGIYMVSNLPPGPYLLQVSKFGFKTIIKPDITLNVQDALALNFALPLGSVSEVVTIQGGAPLINTQDASVSTVIDRQFAENLPLNGRSFQSLIELTPGVVITPSTNYDAGQFSVNGQRPSSTYWTIDGVSANIGTSTSFPPGNGMGGSLGSFSALGGTNSLVSVDALQEFRIQTSTFAPEFGRTPGGQISIVTRSGTNQLHGTVFDYLRNDAMDANDWFANNAGLPKPEERQNDFGGTVGGTLKKDRSFYFFSYEGLRLRLPQVALDSVPDLNARESASPAVQPFLNAYPLPNGPELGNGIATFNASFSNKATLDAYSLRLDHRLTSRVSLFGRYNYSPSEIDQRVSSLSTVEALRITTSTATVGATWVFSPAASNDLRFNYSHVNAVSSNSLDNFEGAIPLSSSPFPSPFDNQNALLFYEIASLSGTALETGKNVQNFQRQTNVVDTLSTQKGAHILKFGIDLRRLTPTFMPRSYSQFAAFTDVPSAETGSLLFSFVGALKGTGLLFRNLGTFAQDTWRVFPRFTVTYGIRWDVDWAPSTEQGPSLLAVTNFNDPANLGLAPSGTTPFKTDYRGVAPRIGAAYEFSDSQNWRTVIRSGFGVFYDLATSEVGSALGSSYPFAASTLAFGGTFPLSGASAAPPPITLAELSVPGATLYGFNPNLRLPYTLQWNLAVQQSLGKEQMLSASYIGASGKRLLQSAFLYSPNANFWSANLVGNTATSSYNSLQVQFERRLTKGIQALASYTLSHSLDDASAGSYGNASNTLISALSPAADWGPSDFDIRNAFSAAITYDIPERKLNRLADAVLHGWSLQSIVQARSAPPLNVYEGLFSELFNSMTNVRPDIVPNQPLYLRGAACQALPGGECPGGKGLNPAAFVAPPTDASGNPLRQGDLGRNALRGFGAAQWDFALHREFPIRESFKLQFRAEVFNVLNHPNFGPPDGNLFDAKFGVATQMLGESLGGSNLGGGGFEPLYQFGGPRSVQVALKLAF